MSLSPAQPESLYDNLQCNVYAYLLHNDTVLTSDGVLIDGDAIGGLLGSDFLVLDIKHFPRGDQVS